MPTGPRFSDSGNEDLSQIKSKKSKKKHIFMFKILLRMYENRIFKRDACKEVTCRRFRDKRSETRATAVF
jgi:hypothetical protein